MGLQRRASDFDDRATRSRGRAGVWCVCIAAVFAAGALADDRPSDEPAAAATSHVGFAQVGEALDSSSIGRIRNEAIGLARMAANGETTLVLEVHSGEADVDTVLDLAEFLVSGELRSVRTISWLPQSVLGPRAILPLVCRELVLHPDAELGDVGFGVQLTAEQRRRIDRLAARRTNSRVSPAVATAMIDPESTLLRVVLKSESTTPDVRIISGAELPLLQQAGLKIEDVRQLKGPGRPAVFTGAQAEAEGFLAAHVVGQLTELAEAYELDVAELAATHQHGQIKRPVLIKVDGQIDPLLTSYLQRQIDRAVEREADAIIFQIDSPGGLLQDSLELAFRIAELREQQIRTVAYVPRDAASGAALISLGCDEIYLHPSGKIGDAGPIEVSLDGNVHRAPEKIVSYLREVVRELAELKGRPAAVLMAMVDRELDVFQATQIKTGRVTYLTKAEIEAANGAWKQGPLVPESAGELLLFVNGRRAHELQFAEPPVQDLTDLRNRLGIAAEVPLIAAEQTWMDDTVFILNTNFVSGFLLFLGVILLFVELHFMVGIAGILSAMCFGVFFWSKFLGGTAGWLEVMLFMIGLACVALEIFVIPGFGVFGIAGGMLILGSLVMAGATLSEIDRGSATTQSLETVKTLGLAILGVIAAAMTLSHFLPKIPILNSMILAPPVPADGPRNSSYAPRPDPLGLTGQQGVTVTMLRPAGKVRINGQLMDAVASNGFLAEGVAVQITEVASNRVIVRPCESA